VLVGVAGTRRQRQVEVLELDVGDTVCAGRCCWYAPAAPAVDHVLASSARRPAFSAHS